MFDFSFTEMLLASTVALIVLGPERLPKAARTIGLWLGKMQTLAANIKAEFSTQTELNELRQIQNEIQDATWEVHNGLHNLARPAWDRLPEQRTPADFGIDTNNTTHDFSGSPHHFAQINGLPRKSLRQQALSRKRDMRPRHRPKPKLRNRR
ncbi:MAG: Sec-independent protein translocase protein TatB [Alysiella sp.]|uniref:Sec-independent protein translocase protein TatB n=1 Tax=Alysiella sp. TaxID=1872483 RepID=UPI0026DBCBFC|nr:Sec-independent protein translocase protein TatB [Alysiella sp.]MDO4433571.1 Sec-independent protein translocase protein TatB [Alysiella sp.]